MAASIALECGGKVSASGVARSAAGLRYGGGGVFSALVSVAFTVDAFYSPLWVTRSAASPRTNDGLFNVRALLSYSFR